MKFRKDINGLRAIAVVSVVLFHFLPEYIPGGFAGVDVFFVISGFLMTSIIYSSVENDNFSVFKFYVSRVNRIIPALLLLCTVVFIFGFFFLTPLDFRTLNKHIASSASFLSNVIYLMESGYFDADSRGKWLLHTWSLSVEWQFYILYPLLIIVISKIVSLNKSKFVLLFLLFISLSFSVYSSKNWPSVSYYMFPSRAWEMLIGGMAYLFPIRVNNKKNIPFYFGVMLIVASLFLFSELTPWPSFYTCIPVIGSYLVILSSRDSFVLNNKLMQFIGRCSYSIYLWHWPLVVFGYYYLDDLNSFVFPFIGLSFFLGFLSYRYVECKRLFTPSKWGQFYKVKPIYGVLIISLLSSFVFIKQGYNYFSFKHPDKDKIVMSLKNEIVMPLRNNGYCFYSFRHQNDLKVNQSAAFNCKLGDLSVKPDSLLFGDSYAGTYDPFLNDVFKLLGKSYDSISTNWCFPSLNSDFTGPISNPSYQQCVLNRAYLKELIDNKKYKNLILAGEWLNVYNQHYLKDVIILANYAVEHGLKVILLPTPLAYKQDPMPLFYRQVYKGQVIDLSRYISHYENNNLVNDIIKRNMINNSRLSLFIDRQCLFNPSGLFTYKGMQVPYTLDGGHMSKLGSIEAISNFLDSTCYQKMVSLLN